MAIEGVYDDVHERMCKNVRVIVACVRGQGMYEYVECECDSVYIK